MSEAAATALPTPIRAHEHQVTALRLRRGPEGCGRSRMGKPSTVLAFEQRGSAVATTDLWKYQNSTWSGANLVGFEVEATDGGIGKIDEASDDVGASYIVVDTGPWILGKKVLLPAGVIETVDIDEEKVYVNRTKDEIKNSPEFDETRYRETDYRDEIGTYYGRTTADRDVF
jgi:hypothetical protein